MKISPRSRRLASNLHRAEDGYILITLILFVALLAIAMTVMAPEITRQIKRDREEELIHRGVQYSRAIKHYVKKFGRYPTRIEELEDTNNLRFLRKRYKDPITGKDFKILHMGDVQMGFGGGLAGATPVSAMAAGGAAGNPNGAFGNSGFGGNTSGFGNSSLGGGNSAFGGNNSSFGNSSFGGGNSGFGNSAFGNNNSAFGGNNSGFGGNNFGGNAPGGNATSAFGATPGNNPTPTPGTDATQTNAGSNSDQSAAGVTGTQPGNGQPGSTVSAVASGMGNQVFGGGPMVGVASTSKDKTIRVFNKKEHYNEWQFIYDPSTDRGGLLATPNQPGLQSLGSGPQMQGAPGTPGGIQGGTQNSSFGSQSSPFGFSGGQQQPGGMQPIQQQPVQSQQPPQPQFPPDQGP